MFQLVGKTHVGAVRDHNEDAFYCNSDDDLIVVADGMGGYAAGEVASDIIIQTLKELDPTADKLVASLVESHQRITGYAEEHPESKGMGAAVVVAKLSPEKINVCWAGDSRAYLYNSREGLKPVSRDHSYVQWLLTQGQITEEEARNHPNRNLVTQCLGIHPPQPELTTVRWSHGDKLLLCSDGLTDELKDATIAGILEKAESTQAAIDRLVEAALSAGGKDNITVVLAENPPAESLNPEEGSDERGSAGAAWLPIVLGVGAAMLLLVAAFVWQWLR